MQNFNFFTLHSAATHGGYKEKLQLQTANPVAVAIADEELNCQLQFQLSKGRISDMLQGI